MTLNSRFKKNLNDLRAAANGENYLDIKNPKLYKKIMRYYEKESVTFTGDSFQDYDIIIENLKKDLQLSEAN
mgnify:FL=1|jgi:hypothetical protein|tara:strand:- start:310 stop:525 length:216 start_codon:yes stop_codon:yes gene_type:complete